VSGLGAAKLNRPAPLVRVVIEKPFGHDLASARELAETVHRSFREQQVFRIDHYLGKETVQNIYAFRFANAIFEPIWSNSYVDHVQITVAESIGVEHRAAFYEETGVVRDIVQNHLLQVLALVAMEPPAAFEAESVRDEKTKLLRAMRPMSFENAVRGQYANGYVAGEEVPAYRQEPQVPADSIAATFIAAKLEIDNWRWAGTPFYIRSGKRLAKRATEVAVQFKRPPHLPFSREAAEHLEANSLVLRIQPDEGISLRFGAKAPTPTLSIRSVNMDFQYGSSFLTDVPEAYETLILDAIRGDGTLFTRQDGVERAWQICDPLIEQWTSGQPQLYAAGSWGPDASDELLARDGRRWRRP
jgi:glucose-6-phosphate 1-dehydrogenase